MKTATLLVLLCLGNSAFAQRLQNILPDSFDPWVKQNSNLPGNYRVFQFHAVDSATIWAVATTPSGPSRVYLRSVNGGATWVCDTIRTAPATYNMRYIFAFDANNAWIAMHDQATSSGGGIFHTENGGKTWTQDTTMFRLPNGAATYIHFFDAVNGVCYGRPTNQYYEIYTTANAGKSWTRVPQANMPPIIPGEIAPWGEFCAAASHSVWVPSTLPGPGRILHSADKGLTWKAESFPAITQGALTFDFQDDNNGLAYGDWGDLKKTTDGGATWTAIPASSHYGPYDLKAVPNVPGMYMAHTVFWYPTTAEVYTSGTTYTLDNGATWTLASTFRGDMDPALEFISPTVGWRNDLQLGICTWVRGTGKIGGANPDSMVFTQIESGIRSDTVIADFVNHGTEPITLTGLTLPGKEFTVIRQPSVPLTLAPWESAHVEYCFSPHTNGIIYDSIVFVSNATNKPRAAVRLAGTGIVYQPVQKGAAYAVATSLKKFDMPLGSATEIGGLGGMTMYGVTIQPSTGWLHGLVTSSSSTKLYRLCSGTAYSRAIQTFSIGNLRASAFDRSGTLYGASRLGRLYRLNPTTGDTVGIGTTPGVVYASLAFSPSGHLWASVSPNASGKDNIYTVNAATGLATLVGATGDGTATPSIFFDRNGKLYGLKGTGSTENTVIAIDTVTGAGTIQFTTALSGLTAMTMAAFGAATSVSSTASIATSFNLAQNFPNPFNPETMIEYRLPSREYVTLKIFDLLGREVAALVNEVKDAGAYRVLWNAHAMPTGVYFYVVQAGTYNSTKRMLVLK